MLRQFKPSKPSPANREDISRMFERGDYHKAIKQCKKAGHSLDEFQGSIEIMARRMLLGHRAGELLSLVHKYGISIQYDVPTLLRAMFAIPDYHGFLKQAHIFKAYAGFEDEIETAIQCLIEKKQTADAEAWRRKFRALRERIVDEDT